MIQLEQLPTGAVRVKKNLPGVVRLNCAKESPMLNILLSSFLLKLLLNNKRIVINGMQI